MVSSGAHVEVRHAVEVLRHPGLPGVVVHRGTHVLDEFEPHFHDEAQITFIRGGGRVQIADRRRHEVGAGDLFVIPSGEVHGGASRGGEGWSFAAIYCSPHALAESMADVADEPGVRGRGLALQVAHDGAGGAAVLALAEALGSSSLAAQTGWISLLAHLLRGGATPSAPRRERALVRKVRAYLDEHLAASVSLDQLTAVAQVSKEYLVRSFTADVGQPPHAYQVNARVERAKQLLLRGDAISEVALALGFHDQSHFTRHFRRIVGVPPGRFSRPSRR